MSEDRRKMATAGVRGLVWSALWPVRAYIQHSPIRKGKSLLERKLLDPLIPKTSATFVTRLRDGLLVELNYKDVLGRTILMEGDFEPQERHMLSAAVTPGSVAIDVGANIGLFTVAFARAAGSQGMVIAFEPVAVNGNALRRNLDINGLTNVALHLKAASDQEGSIPFHLADDPAFHSIRGNSARILDEVSPLLVETVKLDDIWISEGRPHVSVLKVDVEGTELAVLRGARQLLTGCKPLIMLEAISSADLMNESAFLAEFGYKAKQPKGFMPWNHLFWTDVG